jgi:neutral ceramidase
MPDFEVTDPATGLVLGHLCNASMGQSFAAGTTDGPGMFDFEQSNNSTDLLWVILRDFLHKPSASDMACQEPKDILLPTGNIQIPHPWADKTVPVQVR